MRLAIVLLGSAVALSGCLAEPEQTHGEREALGNPAILVVDSGHWQDYVCDRTCWRQKRFWVDFSVRDDDYDKEVAIVWTDDDWDTHQVARAGYEEDLADGRERWGVEVEVGAFAGPNRPLEVQYAAFVKMAGQTHWEPFNDHYVYGKVTADRPVQLLQSRVTYDAEAGGVLAGTVRVFNFAYGKDVTIRYSIDGGSSWSEAPARWKQGGDWTFRVEGLGTETLPDEVRFAVRYRTAGREYWDNNHRYDYRHRMEPRISISTPSTYGVEPVEPMSGILRFHAYAATDIPMERFDLRVDDGAWTELTTTGSRTHEVSTIDLTDGDHQLVARAVLEGGYESAEALEFAVENRLMPLGTWQPSSDVGAAQDTGSSSGVAVDDDGRVHFAWRAPWSHDTPTPFQGVVRFASFGTDAVPTRYEEITPEVGYSSRSVEELAVDGQGRVYGVQTWPWSVWRWTAAGDVDTGFATDGRIDFGTDFQGHYLDHVADIATGGGHLWVLGRCPSWVSECDEVVVRFDDQGEFAGMVPLPAIDGSSPRWADVGTLTYSDGALWVLTRDLLHLVGERKDVDGPALLDSVELDPSLQRGPSDVVRTDEGLLFVLDGAQGLTVLDDAGVRLTRWRLSSYRQLPGSVRSPRQLAVLGDGNVAILDGQDTRLVVFDDELAGDDPVD